MPSPVLKRVPRILARSHLGVGLEAAGAKHHAFGLHFVGLSFVLDLHAVHAVIVRQQLEGARAVNHGYFVLECDLGERVNQAGPAAYGFNRQPAPELEHAVDLVGLPSPDRHEADTFVTHPQHGRLAALDQNFAQVRIGAIFGDAAHVVEKLFLGVGAEVGLRHLLVGEIRHQRAQILNAVINAAERTGGEPAVAAGLFRGRAFQHQH